MCGVRIWCGIMYRFFHGVAFSGILNGRGNGGVVSEPQVVIVAINTYGIIVVF